MIWFISLYLNKEIHAQGYGFTKLFHKFVFAEDKDAAEKTAVQWAKQHDLDVRKITVGNHANQDVKVYTFLHQIVNLPKDVLEAEYDRRGYSQRYRDKGQYVTLEP